jgi:cell division septation protein DedD
VDVLVPGDSRRWLVQWVLGFGGEARVVEPAWAVDVVRAAAQGLPEATKALNELSQVIQPLDRANGWQIATALANNSGVPPQFQSAILAPPLAAPTAPPPPVTVVANLPAESQAAPQPGSSTASLNAAALNAANAGPSGEAAMGSAPPEAAPPPAALAPPAEPPPVRVAERTLPKPAEKPPLKPRAKAPPPPPPETGWRIQLGSYPNQKTAMAAWTKLAAAQKRDVKGLKPKVSKFGGMYRLQVGPFPTRDEALGGCKKLEIGRNGCFAIDIGD